MHWHKRRTLLKGIAMGKYCHTLLTTFPLLLYYVQFTIVNVSFKYKEYSGSF